MRDDELLIRAKSGNEQAIEELAQIVFLKVLPILNVKFGKSELEPLIEDGVIVALQKFLSDSSVRASTIPSFKCWISTVASNYVVDMMRKTRKNVCSSYINEYNEEVEREFEAEVNIEEDTIKDTFLQQVTPLLDEAVALLDSRDQETRGDGYCENKTDGQAKKRRNKLNLYHRIFQNQNRGWTIWEK